VSGYQPPDDPSEAPTGFYDYSGEEQGSPQRSAWYRNPIVLVALGLFVAILLGIAVYFFADQTHGTGGTTQTPTSPTTSTVAPTSSTEVTTTTEPVAPPETTTMTAPPATTEPTASTPPTATTSVDEGHHHHHHHASGTR
jgi:cytoskeletal protein RodZ